MRGIKISVRNNFPQVASAMDRVGVDVGNRAMVRALNTTVDQGKVQAAREISKEFRISSAQAKERLSIQKARVKSGTLQFEASLEATRRGQGRSMNLIAFVETRVTLAEGKRRARAGEGGSRALRNGGRVAMAQQLRFQIKRSGGKKVIPGAFIGNAGRTVFIRQGKGRVPIKSLGTIDVPQMFNAKRINAAVVTVLLKRFETNFQRELRAVLRGYAK